MSISQVGVWVPSAKVGKRYAVLYGGRWKSERVDEDLGRVGTGDTVQSIKKDLVIIGMRGEEVFDERKVEDLFKEFEIV